MAAEFDKPRFYCCESVSIGDIEGEMQPTADDREESAVTLNEVGVGSEVEIWILRGPGCERLRDLGFCEQLLVRKLAGGRNLLCAVCGTRLVISRDLAAQVLVAPVV